VASSVQWFKCFGTLRPRENTKKPKTPEEMIARSKLKDSDYSDDGSDVTFSDRSLRCHKKQDTKQEKHQMTSRQDTGFAKRFKNESFEVQDSTLNCDSPLEDSKEESHGKQYSSPQAMKSDSQTKVKVMDKGKQQDKKKESTPQWVLTLMSSVKRLEQKVDNTMDEVEVLKKKETAKEQELQPVIKSEKSRDEEDVELVDN